MLYFLSLQKYIENSLVNIKNSSLQLTDTLSTALDNFTNISPTLKYMFEPVDTNKLSLKIIYNDKKYNILIEYDSEKNGYFVKEITGPFLTTINWALQYDFVLQNIQYEDTLGDINTTLDILKKTPTKQTTQSLKNKVFAICIPNQSQIPSTTVYKIKELLDLGATIHLIYPENTKLLQTETIIDLETDSGKIILHPVPIKFYFDNMRLILDNLDTLDGIIDSDIICPENRSSKIYASIRGIKYSDINIYLKTNWKNKIILPKTRRSRVYQYFTKFFTELDETTLKTQLKSLPHRKTLNNTTISILTSEFWFLGGAETYLVLELAYLLLNNNNLTINIVFPDTTLASEYLAPIKFGNGRINFFPIEIEKINYNYPNETTAKNKTTQILKKLIPGTDIAICHHIHMKEGQFFLYKLEKSNCLQ